MGKELAQGKYRRLVDDISAIYEELRRQMVAAYWKIGQRIVEVEQDGEVRAEYGAGLLQKISDDLVRRYGRGFSVDNVQNMRRFYLTHPNYETSRKLGWSQYVALLSVEDESERQALEGRAEQEDLSSRELRRLAAEVVEKERTEGETGGKSTRGSSVLPELKVPSGLVLGTCRKADAPGVAVPAGQVLLDLGFYVNLAVAQKSLANVAVSDKPAYTYAGVVGRVVDGDTLTVFLKLGFGVVVEERLRLRGIDAPEMSTAAGVAAKAFLSALLTAGSGVVVRTHQTDIYGRFVADVLFLPDGGTPQETLSRGVYVNAEILAAGHAVRMK
ncbi:MAG: hypothetical protein HGA80_07985 [Candidatus Omnitrophica bacterium]|nr:hypothetical protein [Candidatus Omnitrophota bacterium]